MVRVPSSPRKSILPFTKLFRSFVNRMSWYTYIIYSESHQVYYKGESEDPVNRLLAHNNNLSQYTKGKGPWKAVYIEQVDDKKQAIIREKQLKKLKHRSIEIAIN